MVSSKNNGATTILIGYRHEYAWMLPKLLTRAGCVVDAITSSHTIQSNKYIRNCLKVPAGQSLLTISIDQIRNEKYQWIILIDDQIINEVLHSNLSIEEKIKLLPITHEQDFNHLLSKINLSQLFLKNGIQSPPALIATHFLEAIENAKQLGFPVLVKMDCSSGGNGVFECASLTDFYFLNINIFKKPVLIQKKIIGTELDLSAIFIKKRLIHFSYSIIKKTAYRKFGPSVLRTYFPRSSIDQAIFHELEKLGQILGADGFVTITCIEATDGSGRYYIEADTRPNVWNEYSQFIDDDPADNIRNWFIEEKTLAPIPQSELIFSNGITIPFFLRMPVPDILTNRYNVWKFIPPGGKRILFKMVILYFMRKFISLLPSFANKNK